MLVYITHVFGFVGKEFKEKTLNEKNHFSKKKNINIFSKMFKNVHILYCCRQFHAETDRLNDWSATD